MVKKSLSAFLSDADQARVVDAIHQAEIKTSGEIKVHIEPSSKKQKPYDRAVQVFSLLHLHKTRERNAVLLYVASDDKKFSFIGDLGIHQRVGDDFWQAAAAQLSTDFRNGAITEGMITAVSSIGEKLAHAFPPDNVKSNQLSDEISTPETLHHKP